jgi:hypothetical protein
MVLNCPINLINLINLKKHLNFITCCISKTRHVKLLCFLNAPYLNIAQLKRYNYFIMFKNNNIY